MSYLHMSPNPPDDFVAFTKVNAQLLNAPTPLKHIPLRIYIPSSPPDAGGAPGSFKVMQTLVAPRTANRECTLPASPPYHLSRGFTFHVARICLPNLHHQRTRETTPWPLPSLPPPHHPFLPLPSHITQTGGTHHLNSSSRIGAPQTLGPALRSLLPSLFPSSRDPVLANVLLHGVPVPFTAPLDELMREAAYPDGWLCLIVILL